MTVTANPGRLARCDGPGCTQELRIERGNNAATVLRQAGWTWIGGYSGYPIHGTDVFCPAHSKEATRAVD